MRLSTYSDYALRVLMQTALSAPDVVTIEQVSQTFGISRNHLVKVVHNLGKLGYLKTRRGCGGGFTLAMGPEEIRVGQVVRQTEPLTLVECFDTAKNECRLLPACRLKGVLAEASAAFFASLDRYTLADLLKNRSRMKAVLDL